MLSEMSHIELGDFEREVIETLDNPPEHKINVEYYENVLKLIKVKNS